MIRGIHFSSSNPNGHIQRLVKEGPETYGTKNPKCENILLFTCLCPCVFTLLNNSYLY